MKDKVYLSASRIDKFKDCSWLYYSRYFLKIPDSSNDGARRGKVIHDILELFLKPKHRKHYDKVVNFGSMMGSKAAWKLMNNLAAKYNVNDENNLEMINDFILVALKYEFFGPKETEKIYGEKEFIIEINDDGKKYNIRGFIDKTFVIKNQNGLIIRIIDYKSSKKKFEADKIDDNIQSMIYQLAAKHLHPEIKEREFSFLFLKFPKSPEQKQPSFNNNHLEGFEWYLTEVQKQLENFTEKNATDNLAAQNKEKSWLCGKEGNKKDGTPFFMCAARKPFYYYVALDEKNEIIESDFEEKNVDKKFKIEKRYYSGCPWFFSSEGKRRNFF